MVRRIVLAAYVAKGFKRDFDALPDVEVVEHYELSDSADEERLRTALDGAWAVVAGSEPYRRATFEAVPDLRAVVRWGTGSDAVDLVAATDCGVAIVTCPGANADAVADMTLALMLTVVRQLPALDRTVRSGAWRPTTLTRDLTAATVVIVGLGAIGRAVVRRLHGFGCRLVAVEPYPDGDFCSQFGVDVVSLQEALPQADVLTLHAPLTDRSHHLIGAAELALLPDHAVVVNTSRGPLIDQEALVDALRAGTIAGAGLDVFEREPVSQDDPLAAMPNVVVTGHVASATELGMRRICEAVIANLRELIAGQLPQSCLNPQAWV